MPENLAKVVLAKLETMSIADMEALDRERLRKLSNLLFHCHLAPARRHRDGQEGGETEAGAQVMGTLRLGCYLANGSNLS
jgi:hypothetical protein